MCMGSRENHSSRLSFFLKFVQLSGKLLRNSFFRVESFGALLDIVCVSKKLVPLILWQAWRLFFFCLRLRFNHRPLWLIAARCHRRLSHITCDENARTLWSVSKITRKKINEHVLLIIIGADDRLEGQRGRNMAWNTRKSQPLCLRFTLMKSRESCRSMLTVSAEPSRRSHRRRRNPFEIYWIEISN